jgi:hypothetical protein
MTPTPDDGAKAPISDEDRAWLVSMLREMTGVADGRAHLFGKPTIGQLLMQLNARLTATERQLAEEKLAYFDATYYQRPVGDSDGITYRDALTAETAAREKAELERDAAIARAGDAAAALTCERRNSEILAENAKDAQARADKLEAFKAFVHKRLDDAAVPTDPPGEHRDAGCRIGQRLDWLFADVKKERDAAISERDELQAVFDRLWDCDMRAIKRWQEAHPGNDLVWPDRGKLAEWLMAERDAHAATIARLREAAVEVGMLIRITSPDMGGNHKYGLRGSPQEIAAAMDNLNAALAANPEAKTRAGHWHERDDEARRKDATAQPKEAPKASDRCPHGVFLTHLCRDCENAVCADAARAWMKTQPEPTYLYQKLDDQTKTGGTDAR